jgi:D-alanyl-D-alanine carboxypeptidase
MNYKQALLAIIAIILFDGCKVNQTQSSATTLAFQKALDSQISENASGILASVISKDKNIVWSGASGYDNKQTKTMLFPHQTFRIASVTKTFVASSILRLWEDKKLQLEDPISKYISNNHVEILKKGGYNPDAITINHLLRHSSGLADHTHSEKYELKNLKTNHFWTRTEQLSDLVTYMKPVGEVGKAFEYSDTGYILLGETIETITQKPLGLAIEELLSLKKLGIKSIHIENEKGEFGTNRMHQYYQNEDTYAINPTCDLYGGGGLLSSTKDLCLFYQNLFEGNIFRNKTTLTQMLSPANYSNKPKLDYRIGIWQTEIEGLVAYTHSGFWGTQVVYIPSIKASIAVNYNQYWNTRGNAPIIPLLVKQLLNDTLSK